MKRLHLLVVLVLILMSAALVVPVSASHLWELTGAECDSASNTVTVTLNYDNDGTDEAYFSVAFFVDGALVTYIEPYDDDDVVEDGEHSFSVSSEVFAAGVEVLVVKGLGEDEGEIEMSVTCGEGGGGAGAPCANVSDGRINNSTELDCAAPVAVYQNDGRIEVYGIDPQTGTGARTIVVSPGDIADVGVPTGSSAVLFVGANPFTGQPLTLYRLISGEFQLNTAYADGKPYSIVWSADSTSVNHLAS